MILILMKPLTKMGQKEQGNSLHIDKQTIQQEDVTIQKYRHWIWKYCTYKTNSTRHKSTGESWTYISGWL
jgi:hypothetical protein